MNSTAGIKKALTYQDVFVKQKSAGSIQNLSLEKLHEFPNHPFYVRDDAAMKELMQSIHDKGVLDPIIVRPRGDG